MQRILAWLVAKRVPLIAIVTAILAILGITLPLTLGGSGSTQPAYHVKLPTGQTVVQAHSPALAAPKPGVKLPAALVPVPAPAKARAVAHAKRQAPVSHLARKLTAHVAARTAPRFAGDAAVSTVEQFDSVTTSTIPSWAQYVAGYVNGSWRTYFQMKGRYAHVIGISVTSSGGADCVDLEPGNPGPGTAGPWARGQLGQGNLRPCVYSMLSWMPQIRDNLAAYGIPHCVTATQQRCYVLWDANWTYSRHLDSGYDCTQWTDRAYGLNLDESTCLTSFYLRSAAQPKPKPDPYAVLSHVTFVLYGQKMREYNTVKTWYASGCRNPVRRGVCVSTRRHLISLRDRLWRVTWDGRECISVSTCQPNWRFARRGARLQLLERPIGSWTAKR